MKKPEAVRRVIDAIAPLDTYLDKNGFTRRKSSLMYRREIERSGQAIELVLQMSPKDEPSSLLAIYPYVEVVFHEIESVMEAFSQGLGVRSADEIMRYPAARLVKSGGGRWFVWPNSDLVPIIDDIADFAGDVVGNFLGRFTSATGLAGSYDDGVLVPNDESQSLRVVASMLILQGPGRALEVFLHLFHTPLRRKQYNSVFEYLNRLLM